VRIAVLHYHLRRGGVTRVVQTAARALAARGVRLVAVCGEDPGGRHDPALPVVVETALAYGGDADPAELYDRLARRIAAALGGTPDVWHLHNHSLGKNLALPRLARHLAVTGQPVLLQPHDFAEDYRPANYTLLRDELAGGDPTVLAATLYPVAPHVLYAVLTQRDARALLAAGLPAEQVEVLPNPVAAPVETGATTHAAAGDRVVYPVRAIRRKNIGEFMLWSAIDPARRPHAITLPPTSGADLSPYAAWRELAASRGLSMQFAVGEREPFDAVISGAAAIATTSIAEGFGLVYAEPWLSGKPLVGRRIDGVADDLEALGLDLSGLYRRFDVPLDWFDRNALRRHTGAALTALAAAYGLPVAGDALDRAWRAMVQEDRVDFGRLDESWQHEAVRRAVADPSAVPPHPLTEAAMSPVARNRDAVINTLGAEAYAERLHALYQRLADAKAAPLERARGTPLTASFMTPENLWMVRT
jgi:hypothetical protein